MILKGLKNIIICEFGFFSLVLVWVMNTNALHLCNFCLFPYEIHADMERPVLPGEMRLQAGS